MVFRRLLFRLFRKLHVRQIFPCVTRVIQVGCEHLCVHGRCSGYHRSRGRYRVRDMRVSQVVIDVLSIPDPDYTGVSEEAMYVKNRVYNSLMETLLTTDSGLENHHQPDLYESNGSCISFKPCVHSNQVQVTGGEMCTGQTGHTDIILLADRKGHTFDCRPALREPPVFHQNRQCTRR